MSLRDAKVIYRAGGKPIGGGSAGEKLSRAVVSFYESVDLADQILDAGKRFVEQLGARVERIKNDSVDRTPHGQRRRASTLSRRARGPQA
jgi:hypothetical protein